MQALSIVLHELSFPEQQLERQPVDDTRESPADLGQMHWTDTCLGYAVTQQAGQESIQSKCQSPQNQK